LGVAEHWDRMAGKPGGIGRSSDYYQQTHLSSEPAPLLQRSPVWPVRCRERWATDACWHRVLRPVIHKSLKEEGAISNSLPDSRATDRVETSHPRFLSATAVSLRSIDYGSRELQMYPGSRRAVASCPFLHSLPATISAAILEPPRSRSVADAALPREVNLTKRVQTIKGMRYCPVVPSPNGRVKPDLLLVNRNPERSTPKEPIVQVPTVLQIVRNKRVDYCDVTSIMLSSAFRSMSLL